MSRSYLSIARSSNNSWNVVAPSSTISKTTSGPSRPKPLLGASKPGCPHCRNLGLPHEHWLRESPEPNSKVVCPVLLATECRYCKEYGHTVSGCPKKKLANSSSMRSNATVSNATVSKPPLFCVPSPEIVISNIVNAPVFAVAYLSNGSDYVAKVLTAEEIRSAEEFSAKLRALYTSGISWADLEDMEI